MHHLHKCILTCHSFMPVKVKVPLLPTLNVHAPHLPVCCMYVPACVHTYVPQILACLWSICSLSPLFLLGSPSSRRLASAKDWATNLLSVGGCGVYWLGPRPSTLLCTGEHSKARIVYNGYLAVQSCVCVQPEPLLSLRTLKLVPTYVFNCFVCGCPWHFPVFAELWQHRESFGCQGSVAVLLQFILWAGQVWEHFSTVVAREDAGVQAFSVEVLVLLCCWFVTYLIHCCFWGLNQASMHTTYTPCLGQSHTHTVQGTSQSAMRYTEVVLTWTSFCRLGFSSMWLQVRVSRDEPEMLLNCFMPARTEATVSQRGGTLLSHNCKGKLIFEITYFIGANPQFANMCIHIFLEQL